MTSIPLVGGPRDGQFVTVTDPPVQEVDVPHARVGPGNTVIVQKHNYRLSDDGTRYLHTSLVQQS